MTAGLDGLRESRPYQLVGIGIPLRRSGVGLKNRSCDKCLKTLERVKGFPRGHIGLLPRYVLVRNSSCYLIAASSNNLVKAGYAT